MESVWNTVQEYGNFYSSYAAKFWNNLSPEQYGYILIGIALVGYLLMKNHLKSS